MKKILLLCILILFIPTIVFSLCNPVFLNPVTEVGWVNLFPLKIGGVTIYGTNQPDPNDNLSSPLCICAQGGKIRIGLNVSMWEPYRSVDAVYDPGCFPSLGVELEFITGGHGDGGVSVSHDKDQNPQQFAHGHFIISPFLYILELFKDITCLDQDHPDLDIAYVTEVDPTWNDDFMAMILNPEVLLFANPITGMACMADAIATTFGLPIDKLFWCMGSWESAYPLTGSTHQDTIIDGASAVAGRMIYKMCREMLLLDRALDQCAASITPIWIKSHYKLQPTRPKSMTSGSIVIGANSDFWAYKVFEPFVKGYGNWSFLLWRKIHCCLGYNIAP